MPKRTDIHHILIIGSGPIVIGQACEFDYAGTQACMALKEEGYRVTLINSNPATIMTDMAMADATYIEPITKEFVAKIIEKERPDALLPTMGGQTALNVALELEKSGVLAAFGVEMLGADSQAIQLAEDRTLFRQTMQKLGLDLPKSGVANNLEEAKQVLSELQLPIMVRPSFILGGSGSGIAHTEEEFFSLCSKGQGTLLLDEALIGWKEFEMEVVRDKDDNCIIVCCIENIDPLGIHTGDSITVAPALTLTDKEYQKMRDASFAILRAIGVETGGSNVQFAVHPKTGRMVVIEMNPRVSRSSALASKATGFPIAKIAAKLAVGYTLPELSSEMTSGKIPASFEPSLDYVVVKIPRFNFDKFPGCEEKLGTQMHSVGEAMGIGRTFSEALLKAMRSMEVSPVPHIDGPYRIWGLFEAFRKGATIEELHSSTHIDPWFLHQIQSLVINQFTLEELKQKGFSDADIAKMEGCSEEEIRTKREEKGIIPVFKRIDSCAGEFATSIAYLYSTYGEKCEAHPSNRPKVMILGSGPSRIGQGIEFDYSCVHAIQTLKKDGYETIIVNCNPETVSTDYDCADKLYFAPLTLEDVLAIVRIEKPLGVIVQYGGQTPLNLASALEKAGIPLLGMSSRLIAETEDRGEFKQFLQKLGLKQPENIALRAGEPWPEIQFPVIVRPSFVLGGRAMAIAFDGEELQKCLANAFQINPSVLLERFLIDAIEVDIDAVCDGSEVFIPGIMEHVEPAGVHSGDSAISLPPFRLSETVQQELLAQTKKIALGLNLVGIINVQFAIQGDDIYVLEVNPRASRTCPFITKATGIDLIEIATRCLMGVSLKEQCCKVPNLSFFAVKEAVLPFSKFGNVDSILGPEMKSTGEVMGIGKTFAESYAKAQIASGYPLPKPGCAVFIDDVSLVQDLAGFKLYAYPKIAAKWQGIQAMEDPEKGDFQFIIALGKESHDLRRMAVNRRICHATTFSAAKSLIKAIQHDGYSLHSLQELL